MENMEGLEVSKNPEHNEVAISSWSRNTTLVLLDFLKNNFDKVGMSEVKSMKKLWELASKSVNDVCHTSYSSNHCENRWRVIKRNYKKVNHNNKSGRIRKCFEFQKEMDDILGKKKSFHSELLPSTGTVHVPKIENYVEIVETRQEKKSHQENLLKKKSIDKQNVLEQMRLDKKDYYRKFLDIQWERVEIERQKLKEKRIKNQLLQEFLKTVSKDKTVLINL